VICIYDNWQSIIADPPDALNVQHRNDRAHTDSNKVRQYSVEPAERVAANKPKGAERSTPAGCNGSHD
jgi:hypothetical protein